MAKHSKYLRAAQGGRVSFWCEGCNSPHSIYIEGDTRPTWKFDGNTEAPTMTPSVLITWKEPSDVPEEFDDESKDVSKCCHLFVTKGELVYLSDCTHELAGQKRPMRPIVDWWT